MAAEAYKDPEFDARSEALALHDEIRDLLPKLPSGEPGSESDFLVLSGNCGVESQLVDGAEIATIDIQLYTAWSGIWRNRSRRVYPVVVGEIIQIGTVDTTVSAAYFLLLPMNDFGLKLPHRLDGYDNPPRGYGRKTADARFILQNTNFLRQDSEKPTLAAMRNLIIATFDLPRSIMPKNNNS